MDGLKIKGGCRFLRNYRYVYIRASVKSVCNYSRRWVGLERENERDMHVWFVEVLTNFSRISKDFMGNLGKIFLRRLKFNSILMIVCVISIAL